MTRIRNVSHYLELCLTWSVLGLIAGVASSSSSSDVAPHGDGLLANDLPLPESFPREELNLESPHRSLLEFQIFNADEEGDGEGEETTVVNDNQAEDEDDEEDDLPFQDPKISPFYFATPTPTSAPMPGDFKELNELFRTAVLDLPDTDISEQVLFQVLQIALRNLECSQLGFDDLKISPDLRNQQEAGVDFSIVNFGLMCEFDFAWSYIFLVGNGHAQVRIGESSAKGGMDFFSENFDQYPPDRATVTSCETDIKILGLDFSGNIASQIFNLFSQLIVDTMNGLLNDMICGEMKQDGSDMIEEALDMLYEEITPYLQPAEAWRYNVSYPESMMEVPDDVNLVSWNDDDGIGQFMAAAMEEMEYVLGSLMKEENPLNETLYFPNGTAYPEGYDLGINVLLREYMLEDDRSFSFNVSDMGMNESALLMSLHDQLTETNITLLDLKVYGLDTFTVMEPFQKFGNFTLQNTMSWEYLHFDVTILFEMQASSLEDSIIRDPERVEPYVEEVRIGMGIEDVETVFSVLFALDPARMEELQLGSVTDVASAVPCLAASLHEIAVAGLNVSVGDVRSPFFSGFVSPGLDRLFKDGIDLGFFMYKGTMLQALPAFFASTVRDIATEAIGEFECPELELPKKDSFMDLRDLLLDEEEAKEAGATGLSPYGDLTSSIYGVAQEMWEEVEEDGTLGLNSLVIEPVTESISGVPGRLEINGTLVNFTTNEENQEEFRDLVQRFEVSIFDLVIENLNTVVHPMAITQPLNHPYITQTTLNMGPIVDAPINATINVLMALDIENSPLAQENLVTFGFSMASIEIFVEALTMLSTKHFLNYRLGDLTDTNCWFSVIPAPELNSRGYRVEGTMDKGVEMRRFLSKVSDFQMHIDCIKCSPGLASLPNMVDIFDRTEVTRILSYRIPLLAEELAISEAMQVGFDRWLVDAPYSCPHRPEYDPNYERPDTWETVEFTQLSLEASDTIFFSLTVAAEVAFVMLVETHYPWELNTLEPLSGQENFVAPEGSNIFNFTNVTDLFDSVTTDIREYLGEVQVDQETKEEDLGINLLMRGNFFADSDGYVDLVELISGPVSSSVEGVVFMFHAVKIRGLDSFTRFDILKPIAEQTLLNSMHLRYLELELEMSTGSRTAPEQIVTYNFKMEDINITLPIFAAIDLSVLQSLELGHFLLFEHLFDCLLTSAIDIHFPQILLTFGHISTPTFKGFMADSGQALKESMSEVFEAYGERAVKAIPIMFDISLRNFINSFMKDYINNEAECIHIKEYTANKTADGEEPYAYTDFVDFRDLLLPEANATALGGSGESVYGNLARLLIAPIHKEITYVDPATGLSTINNILGPLGEIMSGEDGTIIVPATSFPQIGTWNWEMGTPSNITMLAGDLRIEGIDTVGAPLALWMPIMMRPFQLRNSAGLGMGGKPISVALRFTIEIVNWNEDVTEIIGTTVNDVVIRLSMENATGIMDVMSLISENNMVHFPMRDAFNPYCWLSLIPSPKLNEYGIKEEGEQSYLSFEALAVEVAKVNLTVECLECESTGARNLVNAVSNPGAVESLTKVANDFINIGENLVLGNLVQDNLDRVFSEVSRYCPHHPNYIEDKDLLATLLDFKPLDFSTSLGVNSLVYLLSGVVFSLVIAISVVGTIVKWIVNRRHQRWLRTLPVQKVHIIQHLQWADDQLERELNEGTSAMITTPEIPAWIRWFMPVIIIGNCAMFLSGHLNVAAQVAMTIVISGEPIPMDQFFSFSVIDSTIQMWEAGAIEMAVFLLIFSGLWPYTKQLISLLCWCTPPSRISISTRGNTYLWLDILAKWSMIDIFVILLYMISFRVKANTPDVAFLPENFFKLEFYIIPRWGIYANLIAQMISQLSSHFIIHYHRMIVRKATKEYELRHHVKGDKGAESGDSVETAEESDAHSDNSSTEKVRLCDGAFARPHKGESSKLITRQMASYALVVGTFFLIVSLILGGSLTFMSVEIQGLMSYLSGKNAYNAFNLFDLAALLYNDGVALGGFNNIAGHILLGAVMVLTVFLAPILQAILLAIHWFKPMDDKQRRKLAGAIEILAAWQYAEVFILATLVCSWQQGSTSELVMYELCYDFNEVFRMLAYYGVIEKEKAHCFRVEATILTGAYFLLAGTVLLALLNSFVMKASFHHFWDKECIRKEEAMDEHLTFEEAESPVEDKTFKEIRPPPVLFTDTFRWVLRPEHLGDRPLKSKSDQQLEGLLLQDGEAFCDDDVEKLSNASSPWQPKSVEDSLTKSQDSLTKSADDTKSFEADGSETDPKATKMVDVDDLEQSMSTNVYFDC